MIEELNRILALTVVLKDTLIQRTFQLKEGIDVDTVIEVCVGDERVGFVVEALQSVQLHHHIDTLRKRIDRFLWQIVRADILQVVGQSGNVLYNLTGVRHINHFVKELQADFFEAVILLVCQHEYRMVLFIISLVRDIQQSSISSQ